MAQSTITKISDKDENDSNTILSLPLAITQKISPLLNACVEMAAFFPYTLHVIRHCYATLVPET